MNKLGQPCEGHGVCTYGEKYDTGTCKCDDTWYGESCQVFCTPDLCRERDLLVHAMCTKEGTCVCRDDVLQHWVMPSTGCVTCKRFYWGSQCALPCRCSGHGDCKQATGECICFANDEDGYWQGTTCDICQDDYVGEICNVLNVQITRVDTASTTVLQLPVVIDQTTGLTFVDTQFTSYVYVVGSPVLIYTNESLSELVAYRTLPVPAVDFILLEDIIFFLLQSPLECGCNMIGVSRSRPNFNETVNMTLATPPELGVVFESRTTSVTSSPSFSVSTSSTKRKIAGSSRRRVAPRGLRVEDKDGIVVGNTSIGGRRLLQQSGVATQNYIVKSFPFPNLLDGENGTCAVYKSTHIYCFTAKNPGGGVFFSRGPDALSTMLGVSQVSLGNVPGLMLLGIGSLKGWAAVYYNLHTDSIDTTAFIHANSLISECRGACLSAIAAQAFDSDHVVIFIRQEVGIISVLLRYNETGLHFVASTWVFLGLTRLNVVTVSATVASATGGFVYLSAFVDNKPSTIYKLLAEPAQSMLKLRGTIGLNVVGYSDREIAREFNLDEHSGTLLVSVAQPKSLSVMKLTLWAVARLSPSVVDAYGTTPIVITGDNFIDTPSLSCQFGNPPNLTYAPATFVDKNTVVCEISRYADEQACPSTMVEVSLDGRDFTQNQRIVFRKDTVTLNSANVIGRADINYGTYLGNVSVELAGVGFMDSTGATCRWEDAIGVIAEAPALVDTSYRATCVQPPVARGTFPPAFIRYSHDGHVFTTVPVSFNIAGPPARLVVESPQETVLYPSGQAVMLKTSKIAVVDQFGNPLGPYDGDVRTVRTRFVRYTNGITGVVEENPLLPKALMEADDVLAFAEGRVDVAGIAVIEPRVGMGVIRIQTGVLETFVIFAVEPGEPFAIHVVEEPSNVTFNELPILGKQPIVQVVDAASNWIVNPTRSDRVTRVSLVTSVQFFNGKNVSTSASQRSGNFAFNGIAVRGYYGFSYPILFYAPEAPHVRMGISRRINIAPCMGANLELAVAGTLNCITCPEGAVCNGTVEYSVKPGYWRPNKYSTTLFPCGQPFGAAGSCIDGQCRKGSFGPRCSSCDPGYGKASASVCAKCPPKARSAFAVLFISIAFMCLIGFMVKSSLKSQGSKPLNALIKLILNYLQMSSTVINFAVPFPSFVMKMFSSQKQSSQSDPLVFNDFDCALNGSFYQYWTGVVVLPTAVLFLSLLYFVHKFLDSMRNEHHILLQQMREVRQLRGVDANSDDENDTQFNGKEKNFTNDQRPVLSDQLAIAEISLLDKKTQNAVRLRQLEVQRQSLVEQLQAVQEEGKRCGWGKTLITESTFLLWQQIHDVDVETHKLTSIGIADAEVSSVSDEDVVFATRDELHLQSPEVMEEHRTRKERMEHIRKTDSPETLAEALRHIEDSRREAVTWARLPKLRDIDLLLDPGIPVSHADLVTRGDIDAVRQGPSARRGMGSSMGTNKSPAIAPAGVPPQPAEDLADAVAVQSEPKKIAPGAVSEFAELFKLNLGDGALQRAPPVDGVFFSELVPLPEAIDRQSPCEHGEAIERAEKEHEAEMEFAGQTLQSFQKLRRSFMSFSSMDGDMTSDSESSEEELLPEPPVTGARVLTLTLLIVLFMFHPTIVQYCLLMTQCDQMDLGPPVPNGVHTVIEVLHADRSLSCDSGLYKLFVRAALMLLFIYGFGVPLGGIVAVKLLRKLKDEATVLQWLSFMLSGYVPATSLGSTWWWESVVLTRKFLFVSISVLIKTPQLQIVYALYLIGVLLVLTVWNHPFQNPMLQRVECLSLTCLYITLNGSYMILLNENMRTPFGLLIMAVNALTMAIMSSVLLRESWNTLTTLYYTIGPAISQRVYNIQKKLCPAWRIMPPAHIDIKRRVEMDEAAEKAEAEAQLRREGHTDLSDKEIVNRRKSTIKAAMDFFLYKKDKKRRGSKFFGDDLNPDNDDKQRKSSRVVRRMTEDMRKLTGDLRRLSRARRRSSLIRLGAEGAVVSARSPLEPQILITTDDGDQTGLGEEVNSADVDFMMVSQRDPSRLLKGSVQPRRRSVSITLPGEKPSEMVPLPEPSTSPKEVPTENDLRADASPDALDMQSAKDTSSSSDEMGDVEGGREPASETSFVTHESDSADDDSDDMSSQGKLSMASAMELSSVSNESHVFDLWDNETNERLQPNDGLLVVESKDPFGDDGHADDWHEPHSSPASINPLLASGSVPLNLPWDADHMPKAFPDAFDEINELEKWQETSDLPPIEDLDDDLPPPLPFSHSDRSFGDLARADSVPVFGQSRAMSVHPFTPHVMNAHELSFASQLSSEWNAAAAMSGFFDEEVMPVLFNPASSHNMSGSLSQHGHPNMSGAMLSPEHVDGELFNDDAAPPVAVDVFPMAGITDHHTPTAADGSLAGSARSVSLADSPWAPSTAAGPRGTSASSRRPQVATARTPQRTISIARSVRRQVGSSAAHPMSAGRRPVLADADPLRHATARGSHLESSDDHDDGAEFVDEHLQRRALGRQTQRPSVASIGIGEIPLDASVHANRNARHMSQAAARHRGVWADDVDDMDDIDEMPHVTFPASSTGMTRKTENPFYSSPSDASPSSPLSPPMPVLLQGSAQDFPLSAPVPRTSPQLLENDPLSPPRVVVRPRPPNHAAMADDVRERNASPGGDHIPPLRAGLRGLDDDAPLLLQSFMEDMPSLLSPGVPQPAATRPTTMGDENSDEDDVFSPPPLRSNAARRLTLETLASLGAPVPSQELATTFALARHHREGAASNRDVLNADSDDEPPQMLRLS